MILQPKYIEDDELLEFLKEIGKTLEKAIEEGLSKKGSAFKLSNLISGRPNLNIAKHILRRFESLNQTQPQEEKVYRREEFQFEINVSDIFKNKQFITDIGDRLQKILSKHFLSKHLIRR